MLSFAIFVFYRATLIRGAAIASSSMFLTPIPHLYGTDHFYPYW